jgi:hypothetical protein
VRRVYLHTVEAGQLGGVRARREPRDDFCDFRRRHRNRLRKQLAVFAQIQRHRRGCPRVATQTRHHLAARMIELHPELGALLARRLRPFDERRQGMTLPFGNVRG